MVKLSAGVPIRNVIDEAASEIWQQLFKCYQDWITNDAWVDTNSTNGGIICNCEALMTIMLLIKNYPDEIRLDQITPRQAKWCPGLGGTTPPRCCFRTVV